MGKLYRYLGRKRTRTGTTQANLVVRYASLAITTGIGFLMVPLYLAHIPAEIYGFWLAAGYFLVLITTCDPGLAVVLQQKVAAAYGQLDMKLVGSHIGSGLLISAVICCAILAIGLAISSFVPAWVGVTSPAAAQVLRSSFAMALTGTALALFSFSLSAMNQGLQSNWAAGLCVLVVNICSSVLSATLLVWGFGVQAIAIGTLAAGGAYVLAQAAYLLLRLRLERCSISLSRSHTKSLWGVFSYTIIGRAASVAANNVDLLFVCILLDARAVVLLSVSRKAIELSRELINQLVVSFMPALSHLHSQDAAGRVELIVTRLTRILIWLTGFAVGGVICFNDDFVALWVGESQFVGSSLNLLLAAALLIGTAVSFLHNIGTSLGNFKGNSLAAAAQSVLYVPLAIYGTIKLGLAGAILAPALAALIGPIYYYATSFKKLIRLSDPNQAELLREMLAVSATIMLVCLLFPTIKLKTWPQLFSVVPAYIAVFFALSFGVSSKIRGEYRLLLSMPVRAWGARTCSRRPNA